MRGAQYRRQATFFIINYELILRDLSLINESLRPDLIIMDEAQRIKNWRTKIASAVKLIPSRYAFVLTGTPLENRLEDLYSLMQAWWTKRRRVRLNSMNWSTRRRQGYGSMEKPCPEVS